jgi:dTDP-4-dehydrorhamnose reductase
MKRMRIFIPGGSGLLALNWACAQRKHCSVVLATHKRDASLAGVESRMVGLDSAEEIVKQLREVAPDLVVHTAGLTNVDECEAEPHSARHANVTIARNVAMASQAVGAALVHISTDHLFSDVSSMYTETDTLRPVNQYGLTKAFAEAEIQAACPRALIVRTNFFGWGHAHRRSFSDWLVYSMRGGHRLALFENVYFTPILADSLVRACHELLNIGANGIFNIVGDVRLSKFDFAMQLAAQFGLPNELISRTRLESANLGATRPHDMSLSNAKAIKLLGHSLGTVTDFLEQLRQQELAGRRAELFDSVMP